MVGIVEMGELKGVAKRTIGQVTPSAVLGVFSRQQDAAL